MTPLYLGIDAGGTKTDCVIGHGSELLGQATGASCKIARVGEEQARRNLRETVLAACNAAQAPPEAIRGACIGIAGASLPGVVAWARVVLGEIIHGSVLVLGDDRIAHQTAFGGAPGILIVAGTGSIAYGRNAVGEAARAGGWGPLISDEGSAGWIGREAVAGALREWDRGVRSGLFALVARCWGAKTPQEIVAIGHGASLPRFADLAQPVSEAAERGDSAARIILERAGQELANLAGIVLTRLWPENGAAHIALVGSVLHGSCLVREAMRQAIRERHPQAIVSFAYVRPALGALELASQAIEP